MLVTNALTVGQITVIIRAAIQILSHSSLFLLGLLILSCVPRLATLKTHNVVNHAVGKSGFTVVSVKWVWSFIRRKNDSPRPTSLLVAVTLVMLFNLFTSLSDIGFLGFYTCSVPGPSTLDYPASITTDSLAQSAVLANMANGTDPSTVKAYRCDSITVVDVENGEERSCTSWHNSTWANSTLFAGLNMTDSDILMPRYTLYPHDTGFQAIFGIPQLAPQRKVTLEKAMALEVDMGCMKLGITSTRPVDLSSSWISVFETNGSWRQYAGPDYLYSVLYHTADVIRQYYTPFFNASSLSSDGTMVGVNTSNVSISQFSELSAANIQYIDFPAFGRDAELSIDGNCTNSLRQQLNLTVLDSVDASKSMCSMFVLSGSFVSDGSISNRESQMVCATASQINMVSAEIQTDAQALISVGLTRLPSDLNYLRANYWLIEQQRPDTTVFYNLMPIERYTLSDNPNGSTSHFVVQYDDTSGIRLTGPGSGGTSLSRAGSLMVSDAVWNTASDYFALTLLDAGNNEIALNANIVTQWGGQVGASYILASTGYNGWAARDSAPVVVSSVGSKAGICYNPLYALGFLPLALAASFVVAWSAFILATSTFRGSKHIQELYEGIIPYSEEVYTQLALQDHGLLGWRNKSRPHLNIASWDPSMNEWKGSAQNYLLAGSNQEG